MDLHLHDLEQRAARPCTAADADNLTQALAATSSSELHLDVGPHVTRFVRLKLLSSSILFQNFGLSGCPIRSGNLLKLGDTGWNRTCSTTWAVPSLGRQSSACHQRSRCILRRQILNNPLLKTGQFCTALILSTPVWRFPSASPDPALSITQYWPASATQEPGDIHIASCGSRSQPTC